MLKIDKSLVLALALKPESLLTSLHLSYSHTRRFPFRFWLKNQLIERSRIVSIIFYLKLDTRPALKQHGAFQWQFHREQIRRSPTTMRWARYQSELAAADSDEFISESSTVNLRGFIRLHSPTFRKYLLRVMATECKPTFDKSYL